MYQILTVRKSVNLGPGEVYILLSVSFHTIMCNSGQNKYQVSHIFLLTENIWGTFSKEMAQELVFGDELEGYLHAERMV